jgi:hypothetical protein
MDRPAWTVRTPIGPSAGYQDIPCAGEPPDGCASPVPSPNVGTEATATPLRIDDRVIPVPEVGAYEVKLGEASLPNGILRVAGAELADPWPAALRLSNDGIRLVVRSLVPGRPPFMNLYEHGWWPGVEPVEVLLVFDVRHAGPGATLEIRDVDVG